MTTPRIEAVYQTGIHMHMQGCCPESAGDHLSSLLRHLGGIENRLGQERDEVVRWAIPEILRCQLLRDLEVRYGLECKPYIERLSQLYDHLLAEARREAEEKGTAH